MRGILLSGVLCLAACGGSTDVGQPDEDGGVDGSVGDTASDSVSTDARADSTASDVPDDTSVGDTATDAPPPDTAGDTTPPPTDTATDAIRGDSGGGACGAGGSCAAPLKCCSGACVYEMNDPLNCGGCGIQCTGDTSMCEAGHCIHPTCAPSCASGKVCCDVNGPGPTTGPKCLDGPTCPIGCPLCL